MSCTVSLSMPGKTLLYFIVALAEDPVLARLLWSTPSRRQSLFSDNSVQDEDGRTWVPVDRLL